MATIVRPIKEHEFLEFVRVLEQAAGRHLTPEALEDARGAYPIDRALAVVVDGKIVGGTASDVLELTVPGPTPVPATRVTLTGVQTTHRGCGHASALLGEQLQVLRRRGEVLVVASTSTPGLLLPLGYAPASRATEIEVTPAAIQLDPRLQEDAGRLRIPEPTELSAILPDVYSRHRVNQPGQVSRRDEFWRMWLLDRALYRIGTSDRFSVVFEDDAGLPQGYLTYRLSYADLREQPVSELIVEDLVAVTDEARRALWRYCLTFMQAQTVRSFNVPADEPLRWLLAEPRGLRTLRVRDFLWLRLLDVAAALAARRYAVHDRLVIEVHDRQLPTNTDRYVLSASTGAVRCGRTDETPVLILDVGSLAAAYLGSTTLTALARAGRVMECAQDGLRRADAMFASSPGSWTVTDW